MAKLPSRVVKGLIISGFSAGATLTGGALFAAEGVAVLTAYLNTKHGEQLVKEISKGEGKIQSFPSEPEPKRKKRSASAYSKKYGAAFKKIAPKYKKKNGSWKKDGFKRAQKEAHRMVK